jgi:WD40 repeat protein
MVAAGCDDGLVCLVALEDGRRTATMVAGSEWVEHVAWSTDGSQIAAACGRRALVWSAEGNVFDEGAPHPSTIAGLAWNPAGDDLAVCCYGGVHLRGLRSGARAHLPFKGSLISIAWSPRGKVIACGSQDCSVHFWRLTSGNDSEMTGYPLKPRALSWDSAGTLLATTGAPVICVWRFEERGPEGTSPIQLDAHASPCVEVAFAPRGGVLASGDRGGTIYLWNPKRNRRPFGTAALPAAITRLGWSLDGDVLFGADSEGNVGAWRASRA